MLDLEDITTLIKNRGIESKPFNLEQFQVDKYNETTKESKFGNCNICNNRGKIAYLNEDGRFALKYCKCYKARTCREKLDYLGVFDIVKQFKSIDGLEANEKWEQDVKSMLKDYVSNGDDNWLFLGGQVGFGKTTSAILVLYEISKANLETTLEFYKWDREYKKIATMSDYAKQDEKEEIQAKKEYLQDVDILVIDDFLRHRDLRMTEAERRFAFDIIDSRYDNHKKTIITSELLLTELIQLDESIGTKIYERCSQYNISVKRDSKKNRRLKGVEL